VVHWAHRMAPRFPDGQLYADLRGYATVPPVRPEEVLARFLHALGVPADQVPADRDEAAALYRSLVAGRRILVVLDNARDVQHVRWLLPGSPSCVVLVTSRNRLTSLYARESARHVTLDVLTPGEAHRLLARILPAARLRDEPAAVEALAHMCAYLPLALGIAAANLAGEGMGVAAYVTRLSAGNRLAELEVDGDPDTAVRATFDLSYAVLAPATARLFCLLGVVPGPDVTAEAAAVLVGAPVEAAGRLLDALAAAHLIGQPAPGRYAFHDLLRRYAADLATAEESGPACAAAVARLLEHYLRRLHDAARLLHPEKLRIPLPQGVEDAAEPFPSHTAALAWLDAEWPNLLAATQHAARHGPPSVVWRLADALRGYLWLRSYPVEWLTVARAGLAAAEAEGDLRAEVTARLSLGDVHRYQGHYPHAVEQYRRALALAEEADWPAAESAILGNLGNAYSDMGRPGEGADNYARALEIDRRTGRLAAEAVNLGNLGFVYQELGRFDEAADLHRRALALDRRLGARGSEAIDLANLGETCHALGCTAEATGYLTRALAMHREVGDRRGEAEALYGLAAVQLDGGWHERARTLATAAVALARDTAERRVEAEALNTMGLVDQQTGRHRAAIGHVRRALEVAREAGIRHAEAVALIGLAAAHHALNEDGTASAYAQHAWEMADRCGYRRLAAQALTVLADMDAAAGRLADAVAGWERALMVFDQLGCPESGQVRDRLRRHGPGRGRTARPDPDRS
jgi:tetratricopeptide (TPR) repeat protein